MEIKLIDSMGSDITVVNAARVSFDKYSKEVGPEYICMDKTHPTYAEWEKYKNRYYFKHLNFEDYKLIKYLAKHNHWTPFGHPQITMLEKVPIFVARQRFKHTVGFVYNEVSRRYVDDDPEFFTPDLWRYRPDASVKQGSGADFSGPEQIELHNQYENFVNYAEEIYTKFIKNGVAPEQARMVLPQSMYTEYYVTGSLAAWARAYNLRIDKHAQKEIQNLASWWGNEIEHLFPVSWKFLTQSE